jgi:Putative esterase
VARAGTGSNGRLQVGTSAGHAGVAGTLASRGTRRLGWAGALVATAVALAAGLVGVYRYLDNFWLYRGYAPPHDPAWVTERGTAWTIAVRSAAIGGRSQQVIVYLPPGYAPHPHRRYPVFYLLHGSPGLPNALLLTVKTGVVEDELLARHEIRPMILVMPFGFSGRFIDTEWANGVRADSGWETFLARDVVQAIDARYRTIRSGSARALGGLLGFVFLQLGFQRGGALTTAGVATLITNAVPIAAGMVLFGDGLPSGAPGVARLISFAAVVAGAALLTRGAGLPVDVVPATPVSAR